MGRRPRLLACAWAAVACTSRQPAPADEQAPVEERSVPSVRAALPLGDANVRVVLTHEHAAIHLPGGAPRLESARGREPLESAEDIRASGLTAFDVEAEPSVSSLAVAELMLRLAKSADQASFRLIVRGPDGLGALEVDQRLGPACMAEPDGPRCAGVAVTVMPDWIVVDAKERLAPTEPDCKYAMMPAPGLDEPPREEPRPRPAWDGRSLLTPQRECPTTDAELAAILGHVARLGQRCDATSLTVHADLPWRDAMRALSVLRVEAGYRSVMLSVDENTETHCLRGPVAAELEGVADAEPQPPR